MHPEATVRGGVTSGEGCYVGAGAVLRGDRGDIVIGPGSNTQENCVVHLRPDKVTVIGPSCHIDRGAVIHGATLGRHVMAGMHAVIHDGVSTGDEALVRAGCVVLGDADIPPGNLVVGVPGRIVGEVTEEQKHAWDLGLKLCRELPLRCAESLRQQERTR